MAEKTEKFVLAEESASEEEEEGVFDITAWMDTQLVAETQLNDDPPEMKKTLPSSSPPKTSLPEPSTSTPDMIDELMIGPKATPSVPVPPTSDVLEELMFGSAGTSTVGTSTETKKHCKTCTCFMKKEKN